MWITLGRQGALCGLAHLARRIFETVFAKRDYSRSSSHTQYPDWQYRLSKMSRIIIDTDPVCLPWTHVE